MNNCIIHIIDKFLKNKLLIITDDLDLTGSDWPVPKIPSSFVIQTSKLYYYQTPVCNIDVPKFKLSVYFIFVIERCAFHFYLIPCNRSQQRECTASLVVCAEHIVFLEINI